MNITKGIDGTECPTEDARFPLPKGYALVCPSCGVWKMRKRHIGKLTVWKCSGKKDKSELDPRYVAGKGLGVLCGRIHTDLEIRSFIGLQMVEE